MPSRTFRVPAILCVSAAAAWIGMAASASARPGCHRGNRLGSDNVSSGINAAQPSRAITNPCSSMYRGGVNVRRMEKRRYPNAVVHH